MTIQSLDNKPVVQSKEEKIAAMQAAIETTDPKEFAEKIVEHMENNALQIQDMMNSTIREAQRATEQQLDAAALAQPGVRQLTSDELKFYNAAIKVESFDAVEELMPATVFNRVFDDLALDHPLLSQINFQRVGASTQWIVRKPHSTTAFWGEVTAAIQEMLDHGFETVDMGMYKLSGFLVVAKAMFELGPEWLDRYVRTFLTEVISAELETVVVSGDGNKKPIGMIRDLNGSVVGGIYPEKGAEALLDFTPQTIGTKFLAPATKGGTRQYTGITLIINPFDYASKLFAYGVKQRDDGAWVFGNFPIPGLQIIQSPAVPLNKLIVGKPKDYFMGVGSDSKLEHTDVLRMIEDQRLYLARQLVNGRPIDNEAFSVFDITNAAIDSVIPTTPETP